jgi:2-polyprenyl-3-methyl-5-hydroxy-6-metoxy-1,4-benzoquinol methylase
VTEREFWNDAYRQNAGHVVVPDRLIASLVAHLPTGSALDVGCGTGTNALYLSGYGWRVTGVDWSEHAVFLAERAAFVAGVQPRFEVADAATWNTRRRFDLILILYALPAGGQAAPMIRNTARTLKPGGTIFIADWDRSMADPWGFDPCELHDPAAIVEMLPDLAVKEARVRVVDDMFPSDDPRGVNGSRARIAVVRAQRPVG